MRVVFPKTLTPPADTAVRTVVDLLPAVVVPQLADVAVVARRLCATLVAGFCCLLRRPTDHAKHVLCPLPVQCMVFHFVVTVTAGVPVPTLVALDFDIALVVLTAQHGLLVCMVLLLVFVVVVLGSPIRWARVAWPQLVGVLGVDVGGSRKRRGGADVGEDRVSRVGREGTVVGDEAAGRRRPHVIVSFDHQAMDHLRALLLGDVQCPDVVDARTQMGEAIVSGQGLGHGASILGCSAVCCGRSCGRTGNGRVEIEAAKALFECARRIRGQASCIDGDADRRGW